MGEIPSVVGYIEKRMGDTWSQDRRLLSKFFPIDPVPNPQYLKARKNLFNEGSRYNRWRGISPDPKPMTRIYTPLTYLLNEILYYYGISRRERLFLDTHVRRRSSKKLMPGIWLSGIGGEFANAAINRPLVRWVSCISALEVVLDSDNQIAARNRLAVHMHEIFQSQINRRFAFGLVMTQNTFTVFMFDHSGAVASEPCNYHEHPEQFCAVISGLAAKGDRIGFDHTVSRAEGVTQVCTFQAEDGKPETKARYIIEDVIFRYPSLVGRGTVCWRTSREDDREKKFVVKDAWMAPSDPPGRESEASLLRHANSQGIVAGVVQIHHFEEVRRSMDASDLDRVLRNRGVDDPSPEEAKLDRVHTRMVMSPHGRTLDRFASRKELLLAFHDAVLAHRKLHDVAGILHRDISVRNIIIHSEGAEGNRGVLIDLDHAIRVGDTSPYSTKTHIGTRRYMSRNVLRAKGPHTYLDDLESFYYVLCWVLVAYERPGTLKAEIPSFVTPWDNEAPLDYKTGMLGMDFNYPVASWFGRALHQLTVQLHQFFFVRMVLKPALDPAKDYDEFLAHIRHAILDLEKEELETEGTESTIRDDSATVPTSTSRKRIYGVNPDEEYDSLPPPRRRRTAIGSLDTGRATSRRCER